METLGKTESEYDLGAGPRTKFSLCTAFASSSFIAFFVQILFFNFGFFVNKFLGAYILISAFSLIASIIPLVGVECLLCTRACARHWGEKAGRQRPHS